MLVESDATAVTQVPQTQPALALPPRPRRPLSSWQLFRTFPDNAVAACDEELFEELLVERRFFWGCLFVVSDPDAIHRILVENVDNYIRIPPVRRAFTFTSGSGMNHLEGEEWWRHRRTINPALDYRALLPDLPELIRLSEDMAAHLAALPPGQELGAAELRDEVLTLAAGAQAPLRAMTWGWYLLAQFPAAEERLHAELDAVLGARSPTPEDFPRLVYLRRFIDETMRLYPPLPVMLRTAVADDKACGRHIPKGSFIAIMPWVVHRHRKLWRDPERFEPDRFAPDRIASRSRYAYIPFGVGPRVCVAASLAMTEIQIAIAVLAQRLRFHLVPGQTIEPTAWSTLRPRHDIQMTVEPRSPDALAAGC